MDMKEILIDKIVVNMGVGGDPDEMKRAQKIMDVVTKRKSIQTKTQMKAPEWGLRPGLAIGLKVTFRGKSAREFFDNTILAKEKKLSAKNFDERGNFGFGVKEYIDIPGMRYDPKLGIRGFDVLVTLKRRGYRVKSRKLKPSKVGKSHVINKQEAIDFVKTLGVEIE